MINEKVATPVDRETELKILDAARSVFIRRGTAGAKRAAILRRRS